MVSLSKFTAPLNPFGVHLLLAPSGIHPLLAPSGIHLLLASPDESLVCLGDGLTGGVTQQVRISLETFWRTSSPCSIWAYIFLLLHLAYIFFLLHLAYILFLLHLTSLWCVQVMDSLVVSLSKFTSPLNPLAFKPVVTFGENEKARIATEAVFTVANR